MEMEKDKHSPYLFVVVKSMKSQVNWMRSCLLLTSFISGSSWELALPLFEFSELSFPALNLSVYPITCICLSLSNHMNSDLCLNLHSVYQIPSRPYAFAVSHLLLQIG